MSIDDGKPTLEEELIDIPVIDLHGLKITPEVIDVILDMLSRNGNLMIKNARVPGLIEFHKQFTSRE